MPFLGTTGGGSVRQYGGLANLGYFINNSLRLRNVIGGSPSTPAYLNRTFGSGNQQKWTFSVWMKKTLGRQTVFGRGGTQFGALQFGADDTLGLNFAVGGTTYAASTNQVFRDPAAWYHLVWSVDTTQATGSNRQRLYVNGTEVTSWSSYTDIPINSNGNLNTANSHWIGRFWESTFEFPFSGYMAEVNFIDGQQLTSSSFGKTDGATGQWVPKKFTGAYGTNGFYLKFADTSAATAAAIGKDSSPNGNNWTPNNISVTAGATYDAMIDSPTLSAVASNYATLNPLAKRQDVATSVTFADGNLKATFPDASGNQTYALGTQTITSGKCYWEVTINASPSNVALGIGDQTDLDGTANHGVIYLQNGTIAKYGSTQTTAATFTTNDVIGIAYDASSATLAYYKNGVLQYTVTGLLYIPSLPFHKGTTSDSIIVNFGQRPFAYTPPTGFKSLNTFNLP
jgi:hypothetical protein